MLYKSKILKVGVIRETFSAEDIDDGSLERKDICVHQYGDNYQDDNYEKN